MAVVLVVLAAGLLRTEITAFRLASLSRLAAAGGPIDTRTLEELLQRVERTSPLLAGPRLRIAAATLVASEAAPNAGDGDGERSPAARALALAHEAMRVAPGLADAHVVAGASLADLGAAPEHFGSHFRRAATLEPMRAGLRRRLGKLHLATGNLPAAVDECRTALTLETRGAPELFAALEAAGGPSAPESATPPRPRALVELAAWREAGGDRDRARAAFTAALALGDAGDDPAERAWATRQIQGFNFRQGFWEEADRIAAERLATGRFTGTQEQARLSFDRAESLLRRGQTSEAATHLENAHRLAPDEPAYGERFADALVLLGRTQEAEALLEDVRVHCAAARTCPDEANLRLKRAIALRALARLPEARAEVVRVLQRHPDHAGARRLAASLTHD